MTLYRVTYSHEGGTSIGYEWFPSRRLARRAATDFHRRTKDEEGDTTIERIVAPRLKAALLTFLNTYATHADNG